MNIKNYRLIAHRGLYNNNEGIIENTISSFRAAIEKGYAIELDVQILKDGNLIVFHDNNLLRLTGINKKVYDCSLEYIKSLKLLNSNDKIPTLKEAIDEIAGKTAIVIEIKRDIISHGIEKKVYELLKQYDGEYCIESFNLCSILWFKNNAPKISRGILTTKDLSNLRRLFVTVINNCPFVNLMLKVDFFSYRYKDINNKILNKCKKEHTYLFAWTIDNKKEYMEYKELCDGIIFENFIP